MPDIVAQYRGLTPVSRPHSHNGQPWVDDITVEIKAGGHALLTAAANAEVAAHDLIQARITEEMFAETDRTRRLSQLETDLAEASERLSDLEKQPAAIRGDLAEALKASNKVDADECEAELASVASEIAAAKTRVEILEGLADEARVAVINERDFAAKRIRNAGYNELFVRFSDARAAFNRAIEKCLPPLVIAEAALRAAGEGYAPPTIDYPRSPTSSDLWACSTPAGVQLKPRHPNY